MLELAVWSEDKVAYRKVEIIGGFLCVTTMCSVLHWTSEKHCFI